MLNKRLPSLAAALLAGLGLASAHAAPVPAGTFSAAGLTQSDYTYLGSSVANFTATGTGTLTLRSSSYADSFGIANAAGGNQVTLFNSSAQAGATTTISPSYNPFQFFFHTSGSGGDGGFNPDSPATLFSNGSSNGTDGGQANLAIYEDAATSTYALFFDDGGPSGPFFGGPPNDDNDYNDLVVTYQQAAQSVPEPASVALLGIGLLGLGLTARRRNAV